MPRAQRVCPTAGCPNLTPGGPCAECKAKREQARGTSRQRGYDRGHERRFRPGVLRRDPLCVCTDTGHGHRGVCGVPSQRADHYPLSRRELLERGMDPDDPRHGRGLCPPCDSKQTATRQPGGWHAQQQSR